MPRVYGDVNSGNCYKVKLLLRQLDRPFEWVHVDILAKASRTPQFLAMNPSGQIPVLVADDGVVLPESNAILHYLAEGSALLPPERMAHAQVLRWMFWEQYTHEPSVATARYIVRYLGRPAEHESVLQRRIADGHEALAIMEQHLATRAFLVGERYSIADIALYAYTHVADEGLIDLAAYPAVRAWLSRVRAQPGHVTMQG
jgi:glutathione S-transferase